MPDLNSLLKSAIDKTDPPPPPKKTFSRGIRPDHIARGEVLQNYATNEPQPINDPQTGSKEVAKRVANDPQTGSKEVAKSKIETNPATPFENKRVAKRVADQVANDPQTGSKEVAESTFDTLVGKERELVLFLANDCRLNGSLVTSPITRERVAEIITSTTNRAKNILFRLQEKAIIESFESKTGRGGWTKFKLEKATFQKALIQLSGSKHTPNDPQTGSKHTPNRVAERVAEPPIVVVNSNYKNTTNIENQDPGENYFVIPNDLSGKVSRRQLTEFVLGGKISAGELQVSLDAFAYDLRNKLVSVKHLSNPVGLLIGAIKNNGSYNSAKYIEALKGEMKSNMVVQHATTGTKTDFKASKEWVTFQQFKIETPEDFKKLEEKVSQYGFEGAMLEDFTFLEYKTSILGLGDDQNLNPLRPLESTV